MAGKTGLGRHIATCTLWAPACTVELFKEAYLPAIESGGIGRFALFALTDQAEQDDNCANVYNKSLLYLVSTPSRSNRACRCSVKGSRSSAWSAS